MQKEAKARSESFLVANGIKINKALPFIEAPEELTPQLPAAVAQRSLVLGYIAFIGFGQTGPAMQSQLEKWNLYNHASFKEKALLAKSHYTEQEKINASWLPECIQSLAWGLTLTKLDHFYHCDDDLVTKFPIEKDPSPFLEGASLRPFSEIYFQSDLLYRLHWAARNSRLVGEKTKLSEGLIRERRKAMDWMLGVSKDWDEIPSDT
jgi:hypothetical protein